MNEETRTLLIAELCEDLDIKNDTEDSEYKKLISKLNSAIKAIIREINFPSNYTEKMKMDELDTYYDNIKDLTLYDFLQNGATGELVHNENGTNRTWKSRRECFIGIVSYAQSF
nr:MAG TPA: hypothetical protein [Caudoviricetes sp.]